MSVVHRTSGGCPWTGGLPLGLRTQWLVIQAIRYQSGDRDGLADIAKAHHGGTPGGGGGPTSALQDNGRGTGIQDTRARRALAMSRGSKARAGRSTSLYREVGGPCSMLGPP